jgi:hypothetical protein
VNRGPCATSAGQPADVESQQASAKVIYSNIRWGDIGSTTGSVTTAPGGPPGTTTKTGTTTSIGSTTTKSTTTTSSSPTTGPTGCSVSKYGQCGGQGESSFCLSAFFSSLTLSHRLGRLHVLRLGLHLQVQQPVLLAVPLIARAVEGFLWARRYLSVNENGPLVKCLLYVKCVPLHSLRVIFGGMNELKVLWLILCSGFLRDFIFRPRFTECQEKHAPVSRAINPPSPPPPPTTFFTA